MTDWLEYWDNLEESWLERKVQNYKNKYGYSKLLNAIPLGEPGTSLEIGAGRARISGLLKQRGWQTTALDQITFLTDVDKYDKGDIFNLPYKDKSYDLVLCCGLLEHFPIEKVKLILNEMRRVGKGVVCWFPYKDMWWDIMHKLRVMWGAKMPECSYKHTPYDIWHNNPKSFASSGLIRFGIFKYFYYYEVCIK